MEKNKTGKYFKYAIGEIILVVIGILIALSINNWNEENKQISRSAQYHQRIFEDLNRLINDSNKLTIRADKTLKSITKTTKLLESGKIETDVDKKTIEYALTWFSRTTYKLPELPTYEEMKSNGDLNLIYDIELRNKIASFNNLLKQVETVVDKLSYAIESDFRIYNRHIRTYVNPETLDITYKYDFDKMITDDEFINTFSRLSFHWRGYVYFMKAVSEDGKNLVSQFDNK